VSISPDRTSTGECPGPTLYSEGVGSLCTSWLGPVPGAVDKKNEAVRTAARRTGGATHVCSKLKCDNDAGRNKKLSRAFTQTKTRSPSLIYCNLFILWVTPCQLNRASKSDESTFDNI
jgi:hypothetical protein